MLHMDLNTLRRPQYFGNNGISCKAHINDQGMRAKCDELSPLFCASQTIKFPEVSENDLQFIFFRHVNDKGTRTLSFSSIKSLSSSITNDNSGKTPKVLNPIADFSMINSLVNNLLDLYIYRENVDLVDVSLQQMGDGNKSLFCMYGKLFEGNSLIKGVQVFNWRQ